MVPSVAPPRRLLLLALVAALALPCAASAGTLERPIDPSQQTALKFGDRSHWLQPWRAYLDTPPATALRRAIGINFNVSAGDAASTARLLARSGFRRARIEFGWDQMDFEDPARLRDPGLIHTYVRALRAHGIRPLILLNANHRVPGPLRYFDAVLTAPARKGDSQVRLDPATAAAVVPHRSGLNDPRRAADVLFTSVSRDGTATLSRPLPRGLSAGAHSAATLRYAPFGPPRLADGTPNPLFEETLRGWLAYVGAVTREVRSALGSDAFDVEVWNELTFGSDFLYQQRYYDPPRELGQGNPTQEILEQTVAFLRDPSSGVSGLGIGNGFANQVPWASGVNSPPGLTAIDKHPYFNLKRFPDDSLINDNSPLDALGRADFTQSLAASGKPVRHDRFVPSYQAYFPEYILTGIQTETLIRDLSPITTDVNRVPHGRHTRPVGGGAAPTTWITEVNMNPTQVGLAGEAARRMQAKAALRYFTAFVNKGVSAVHLYAVKGGALGLVDPGARGGGAVMRAVGRLARSLKGSVELRRTRPLRLLEISDRHNRRQFDGDGTEAHPPLYDRDVVAFLPFQLRKGEYVAAAYVMTRNVARSYSPARFRLEIGGLARRTRVSVTDPLTGRRVRVRVVRRGGRRLTVELPLTDSPRMVRFSLG